MDEKMIEWIALEEAGEHGLETDAALIDFAHRFLARINSVFGTFQQRVHLWMVECFGTKIAADRQERNHRFLEESLELVQSLGCTASEAHQLVDYVFGRPVGEASQETGGVMVTLAALGLANDLDMRACGEAELARVWTKVEQIRAKQAAKPKHSPLPEHVTATPQPETPSSRWKKDGEPDPHGSTYDGERAALCMGNLTDDELANAAFLNYDIRPPIEDLISGKAKMPIVYMTAVKERIRWLSRRLSSATAMPEGWSITPGCDTAAYPDTVLIVRKPGVGGYSSNPNSDNIASVILHALATDLLSAKGVAP